MEITDAMRRAETERRSVLDYGHAVVRGRRVDAVEGFVDGERERLLRHATLCLMVGSHAYRSPFRAA